MEESKEKALKISMATCLILSTTPASSSQGCSAGRNWGPLSSGWLCPDPVRGREGVGSQEGRRDRGLREVPPGLWLPPNEHKGLSLPCWFAELFPPSVLGSCQHAHTPYSSRAVL